MSEPSRLRLAPPCESADAPLERAIKLKGIYLRLESLEGEVMRTLTTRAEQQADLGMLVFSLEGTMLYRPDREQGWTVVAPGSVTFIEGPASVPVRIARGRHRALVVYWPRGAMPILERWLESRGERSARSLGTQPIFPSYKEPYERMIAALESKDPLGEHVISSVAMELVPSLLTSENTHCLAPAPEGVPEHMMKLIEAVREDSSEPWPLKEAADFVGYSPFHFSRIFKVQVGMGFHEFVDRTRTEHAVKLLTTTENPIDVVASEAGFGTTQGLRESVKEYLGLVPSELRANPDELSA